MYAKTNWRKYFDEDASPAVHQYLTQNGDRLYPWILKIGSIWHRYKEYVEKGTDILSVSWANFNSSSFTSFLFIDCWPP